MSLEEFYLNKEEPNKSCLFALRDIILNHHKNITETTKYGMPCFCFNDKMFCYLWVDKKTKEPYILVVDGDKIDHPKLEQGSRARMKIFNVNPNKDIDIAAISEILTASIKLRSSK